MKSQLTTRLNPLTFKRSNLNISDFRFEKMQSDLQQVREELQNTKKELVAADLKLMSRLSLVKEVSKNLEDIRTLKDIHDMKKALYKLKGQLDYKADEERCWESFQTHFDLVQGDFYQKVKSQFPQLSVTDLELSAYIRMEMCNKEIANQLNISVRGVETRRYRLKKKLNLEQDSNLVYFLNNV